MSTDHIVFFPATPSKRLASYLFDRGLLYLALIAISFLGILVLVALGQHPDIVARLMERNGSGLAFLMSASYFIYMEGSRGATFGKRFMGCHVVDGMGNKISYRRAVARFLAASLNWLTLGLGLLVIFFRKDRRGLHDIVAGTWVVHDDPRSQHLRLLGKVVIGFYITVFMAAVTIGVLVVSELRAAG